VAGIGDACPLLAAEHRLPALDALSVAVLDSDQLLRSIGLPSAARLTWAAVREVMEQRVMPDHPGVVVPLEAAHNRVTG